MTTHTISDDRNNCPAESLLKMLSGKWKAQILRLAIHQNPLRFNSLLRQLPGSSRQSLAVALKELEESGLLSKTIIRQKPLHIEYTLTEKGHKTIPVFEQIETLIQRLPEK